MWLFVNPLFWKKKHYEKTLRLIRLWALPYKILAVLFLSFIFDTFIKYMDINIFSIYTLPPNVVILMENKRYAVASWWSGKNAPTLTWSIKYYNTALWNQNKCLIYEASGKPLQLLFKYVTHLNNASLCRIDIGLWIFDLECH